MAEKSEEQQNGAANQAGCGRPLMTGALRSDVELIRPGVHGDFPMLFDPQADAYYKINEHTMKIIGYLSETMDAEDFLRKMDRMGMPMSRQELLELLMFLRQNNLMAPEFGQNAVKRDQYQQMREKTTFLRFSAAYLFFKLPPWCPERFLTAARPWISWMASKPLILTLLIPALIGYLLCVRDFALVRVTFMDSLSWAGLAKYFLAILAVKVVHEAAHTIAATHFGCRVRGIGIGFMVFYPRLYTDTTDSWRLPRKKRLLIDAAGIIIELICGGIAALLWAYLPPGVWKSTMFYLFAVSTISTLFVNGNPCIRYDGYYILCDLLNMENLMSRSGEYIKQFWRWHFLKLGVRPHNERGTLLLWFGIVSFIYRIFLYTSIILILYHSFVKAVAVVMMFMELYSILIYPFYRELQTIRALSRRSANRARFYLTAVVLLILGLFLFIPLSGSIRLPSEVVPAERQWVTTREDGYLTGPLKHEARDVSSGTSILRQSSPTLRYASERLKWSLRHNRILFELQQVDEKNFSEMMVTKEKIQSDTVTLEEFRRRSHLLTMLSPADGVFVPKVHELSRGAFLPKGLIVGEVVSRKLRVYAYAADRDIGKIREGDEAELELPDSLTVFPMKVAEVQRIPARLKNSPLLQHFGGPIPVYADEKKFEEYSSVLALYRVDLDFTGTTIPDGDLLCGRSGNVRIRHRESLFDKLRLLAVSAFRREF